MMPTAASEPLRRKYIGQMVRVKLSDGRLIEGILTCLDKFCNLVLREAFSGEDPKEEGNEEQVSLFGGQGRQFLGCVMVPGEHMVKCEIRREP